MSDGNVSTKIGLSLSGGGIRASVFHLGVLRRLAEEHGLENVSVFSTVSGGSLVTAAIFAHSGMRWPGSEAYLSTIYPRLREIITTTSLLAFDARLRHDLRRYVELHEELAHRFNVASVAIDGVIAVAANRCSLQFQVAIPAARGEPHHEAFCGTGCVAGRDRHLHRG